MRVLKGLLLLGVLLTLTGCSAEPPPKDDDDDDDDTSHKKN